MINNFFLDYLLLFRAKALIEPIEIGQGARKNDNTRNKNSVDFIKHFYSPALRLFFKNQKLNCSYFLYFLTKTPKISVNKLNL